MITTEKLAELLAAPENVDLDYKRTFPPHYFDIGHGKRLEARATLVKDVAAMANASSVGPGYLIYGVQDQNGKRTVIQRDAVEHEDEATLREFFKKYLDPPPVFDYGEVEMDGCVVGILKVERVPEYPHVVREALGSKIERGQVWVRRGTTTEIALHAALKQMFCDSNPFPTRYESPESLELIAAEAAAGWECVWVPEDDVETRQMHGWQLVYLPGTRRTMRFNNSSNRTDWQYLMRRRPS